MSPEARKKTNRGNKEARDIINSCVVAKEGQEPPDFGKSFRNTDTNTEYSRKAIRKLVIELNYAEEAAVNKVREWYTFIPKTFFSTQDLFRDSGNCLLCNNIFSHTNNKFNECCLGGKGRSKRKGN